MAISMLAVCVLSSFSKYTRLPAGSTTATAMAQLFLRASAVADAAAFFAVSRLIGMPYAVSGGAGAGACAKVRAPTRIRLSIVPPIERLDWIPEGYSIKRRRKARALQNSDTVDLDGDIPRKS